jgi:hypothetical protein
MAVPDFVVENQKNRPIRMGGTCGCRAMEPVHQHVLDNSGQPSPITAIRPG